MERNIQMPGRLQFVDAMRGVAAMAVLVQHVGERVWSGADRFTVQVFSAGRFGVFLFFLCSGFIIPAAIERHGTVRDFWRGRFFRLMPLYWASLAAARSEEHTSELQS